MIAGKVSKNHVKDSYFFPPKVSGSAVQLKNQIKNTQNLSERIENTKDQAQSPKLRFFIKKT